MSNSLELTQIGNFETGIFDESAAEISAFDPINQRLFVVNGDSDSIDVLNLADPTTPNQIDTIDVSLSGGPNSVAVSNGILAIALEDINESESGSVAFFDAANLDLLNVFSVGVLPDSLTFTPDGTRVVVANEGEPVGEDELIEIDPEGSVSIIDLAEGFDEASVTSVDFTAFNGLEDELRSEGVRIFPGRTTAQDLEPEFVAISADSTTAFVTLQENNAIAVVDLETSEVVDIQGLGLIDFSQEGFGLDASDEDGGINIQNEPVFGLSQPDSIATFEANGETFIVTANEGDGRDSFADLTDIDRVGDLELDPEAFPNAEELQADSRLGRLEVSTIDGDPDGDGDFDQLVAFGTRSFSIRDAEGNLVFDSGDDFEQITAELLPDNFNSDNDDNDSFDSRSDDGGPEPEGVVVGEVGDRTFAFIGLERIGGVIVYDITDPANSTFVQYINNRDFSVDVELPDGGTNPAAGDLGPEGLVFISAEDSPNGSPLLTVSNEVSGNVSIFQIDFVDALDIVDDGVTEPDADDDISDDGGLALPDATTLFGTAESDVLEITGSDGIVNALAGNDLIDFTNSGGGNFLFAGDGRDFIVLGQNERVFADDGDDLIFVQSGGGNSINGNLGADQFFIANAEIPESANFINDFTSGEDTIVIAGLGIGFDDLEITQTDAGALISTGGNDLAVITNAPASFIASNPDYLVFA